MSRLRRKDIHSLLVRLAANPGQSSLLTGLVAAWDLRDRNGARRFDYSTSGYHLTNVNNVGGASGKKGSSFNGTNQKLTTNQASAPLLYPAANTPITIAGTVTFVTAANSSLHYPVISLYDSLSGARGWMISRNNGKLNFLVSQTGAAANVLPNTLDNTLNVAQHFVARWDGANLKFYVSGTEVTQAWATQINRPAAVEVAVAKQTQGVAPNDLYANAIIDNVSIWNRAISDSERDLWYNGGTPLLYPFFEY